MKELLKKIITSLPEVKGPEQKRLSFKEKLKWTLIILTGFFILSNISLFGLSSAFENQFAQFQIILAASFGTILSLGIGPIVTASIVLQLLNGSGIVKFDTKTPEGRAFFQGVQKILARFFIIFEAVVFVFIGSLAPSAALPPSQFVLMQWFIVFQLFLGGIIVLYMDEVINKWGFGSGISLFIAAQVSTEIFVRAFSPLSSTGTIALGAGADPVGRVWALIGAIFSRQLDTGFLALAAILATILVFVIAVYAQAMKVEIPLSFGRIRGHGIRWPLNFMYTSNIPVILIAALLANFQLLAQLVQNRAGEAGLLAFFSQKILGQFVGQVPVSGLAFYLNPTNLIQEIFIGIRSGLFPFGAVGQAAVYTFILIIGSTIFSIFWVQTSGMDARSQAEQIMASGLQVPGFRRDPRVIEQILSRYIFPLTIMGGATVGLLAATADVLCALSRGTGILLAVMIIYKLYEEIAKDHMMDMHPSLRKVMGGGK